MGCDFLSGSVIPHIETATIHGLNIVLAIAFRVSCQIEQLLSVSDKLFDFQDMPMGRS